MFLLSLLKQIVLRCLLFDDRLQADKVGDAIVLLRMPHSYLGLVLVVHREDYHEHCARFEAR